jgi:hypothetical protein
MMASERSSCKDDLYNQRLLHVVCNWNDQLIVLAGWHDWGRRQSPKGCCPQGRLICQLTITRCCEEEAEQVKLTAVSVISCQGKAYGHSS